MRKVFRFTTHPDYEANTISNCTLPERKLLAAVLYRAISDLYSHEPPIVRDAIQWFTHEDRGFKKQKGFTFDRIIDELNFSLTAVQKIKQEVSEALYYRNIADAKEFADTKLEVKRVLYGERVPEGETGGARVSELAEGARVPFREKKRPALRLTY